jgi:hypothetical protein
MTDPRPEQSGFAELVEVSELPAEARARLRLVDAQLGELLEAMQTPEARVALRRALKSEPVGSLCPPATPPTKPRDR